ncbi:MAG TPA: GDYXXLXY domain-containing protein [Chloroflexaceae bacterium]|nr:GDYXXLXY domain-containing protein [Chloroflexaceae bacterium]
MRKLMIGAALLLALAWAGWQVVAKERLAATGRPVLFELGTVDPRSLIQGDYMILGYRVAQEVEARGGELPPRGELAVLVGPDGVARSARPYIAGGDLAAGEVRVDYHTGGWRIAVGPESFFFQEGEAETFAAARYAELRVSPEGEALLVALRDERREVLGRPAGR